MRLPDAEDPPRDGHRTVEELRGGPFPGLLFGDDEVGAIGVEFGEEGGADALGAKKRDMTCCRFISLSLSLKSHPCFSQLR